MYLMGHIRTHHNLIDISPFKLYNIIMKVKTYWVKIFVGFREEYTDVVHTMEDCEQIVQEFIKDHPGAIEQSLPPYKTVPVLRKLGFKKIKVYPNYAFIHKLCKKGVPSILAAIVVHLYKWFDGLIIAEK